MSDRKEPFWAEIAAEENDLPDMFYHLGLSLLYDHPETDTERAQFETALRACRMKDTLGPEFHKAMDIIPVTSTQEPKA